MPLSSDPALDDILHRHQKRVAAMRIYLQAKGYWAALEAMNLAQKTMVGYRKDGKTLKFHHPLSVVLLLTTLEDRFIYPEATLVAAFLHDFLEDHGDVWSREKIEARFGKIVADAVWTLTKKSNGMTKSPEAYYRDLALCPIGSIVKIVDRNHNVQTMSGVFTPDKQLAYVEEVETWYYPMIRAARHAFPQQLAAYENQKILLTCQCRLIQQIHAANSILAKDAIS